MSRIDRHFRLSWTWVDVLIYQSTLGTRSEPAKTNRLLDVVTSSTQGSGSLKLCTTGLLGLDSQLRTIFVVRRRLLPRRRLSVTALLVGMYGISNIKLSYHRLVLIDLKNNRGVCECHCQSGLGFPSLPRFSSPMTDEPSLNMHLTRN